MVTQELKDYIESSLSKGATKEQLREALVKSGWTEADVEEGLNPTASISPDNTPQLEVILPFEENSPSSPPKDNAKTNLKKLLSVGISLLALIILSGGGTLAYFYFFQSPEKVFAQSLLKSYNARSSDFSLELSGEFPMNSSNIPIKQTNNLLFNGSQVLGVNNQNLRFIVTAKGDSEVDESGEGEKLNLTLGLKTTSPITSYYELDLRLISKIIFFKLSQFPEDSSLDLSFLKDQWVKLDLSELEKQYLPPEAEGQTNITKEKTAELIKFITKEKVYELKSLKDEKIDGKTNYHYELQLNKDKLKEIYPQIQKLLTGKEATNSERESLNANVDLIDSFQGELWIDKKDLLPSKSVYKWTLKKSPGSSFNLSLITNNYNKKVEVQIPENVKTFEEIMAEFTQKMQSLYQEQTLPQETVL